MRQGLGAGVAGDQRTAGQEEPCDRGQDHWLVRQDFHV